MQYLSLSPSNHSWQIQQSNKLAIFQIRSIFSIFVPLELERRPCIWRRNHVYIRACLDQHLITIRSPGIHGDHVLQAWTWSFTLLVSSHLLTQHMETVINCSVLHTTCWKLSQHQQRAVHCAGRSRGAWMHGAAMGSCTRARVKCGPADLRTCGPSTGNLRTKKCGHLLRTGG